jgi:hypothetical protein
MVMNGCLRSNTEGGDTSAPVPCFPSAGLSGMGVDLQQVDIIDYA